MGIDEGGKLVYPNGKCCQQRFIPDQLVPV
jgi:hypothetical protein